MNVDGLKHNLMNCDQLKFQTDFHRNSTLSSHETLLSATRFTVLSVIRSNEGKIPLQFDHFRDSDFRMLRRLLEYFAILFSHFICTCIPPILRVCRKWICCDMREYKRKAWRDQRRTKHETKNEIPTAAKVNSNFHVFIVHHRFNGVRIN